MVQRHLTDNLKKKRIFVPDHVKKDLGFSIMSRILAYQQQKQDFFYSRVNTHKDSVVTTKEASRVEPLATIERSNGSMVINPALQAILEEQGNWKDFNTEPHRYEPAED